MGGTLREREEKQVNAQKNGGPTRQAVYPGKTKAEILVLDFILSFMWVCSNALIKLLVRQVLGLGHNLTGEITTFAFKIINMFFFAVCVSISKGAAYNPLTVLAGAVSGDFSRFLFTVGARIPTQVFGSIVAVKFLIANIPNSGRGPKLNVEIHHGAFTEGVLSFMITGISMGLTRNLPGSFFRKNWISSISKITLNILGSDLTGGCMNPASAMGWAFVRGDHITKEHIVVYWLAPVVATLFAVWASKLVFQISEGKKTKSE